MAREISQAVWTIRYDGDRLEFPTLERALSYADRLISSKQLIKHIDPERQVIALLHDQHHPYGRFFEHIA